MKKSNIRGMLISLFWLLIVVSCKQELSGQNKQTQLANLKGEWVGQGHLFDKELNKTLGSIACRFVIENDKVSGQIGEANFMSSRVKHNSTHFVVIGELDRDFDSRYPCGKRKIELLTPLTTAMQPDELDMDFHIKQNLLLDFSMLVGNVKLKRVNEE
jgi:hypothetical protein